MAEWDPQQYLQFKQDRLRPAHELLQRVKLANPQIVVDLGCGPGTSTRILGERFGAAKIIGVDNSDAMVGKAQENYPRAEYVNGDATDWQPEEPVDLIFSNAVFHWLPDHKGLFSKLANALKPAGVLAIQMPDNLAEPSHVAIAEVARSSRWKDLLADRLLARTPLAAVAEYYDWLARDFERMDIWRTSYAHVMPGHEHIVEWVKGAALTPFLSVLDEAQREQFLDDYLENISTAYPVQEDGSVIYHFPRLFLTAQKFS